MHWSRTLQLVDVHCEGEIGRVVTGGFLDIPGLTMAEKLKHINTIDDSFRQLLTSEPRSGPAGSIVLLTPPTNSDADTGFIVLQPDQAHAMSGSNAICAVTALLETGMIEMKEPETVVTLDTAAGLVRAIANCKNGRCVGVTLGMPTAFVEALDQKIDLEETGTIQYDLCFGGVFYALVDVDQFDMEIDSANARKLADIGVALRNKIDSVQDISHPLTPEISGLAYVMFRKTLPNGTIRTCTTLPPGRVDRSPCGTGSSANIASLFARGMTKPGDEWRTSSIIGGEFTTRFIEAGEVAGRKSTCSSVTGRAWVYALSQVGLDESDPFQQGFRLTDTWGSNV